MTRTHAHLHIIKTYRQPGTTTNNINRLTYTFAHHGPHPTSIYSCHPPFDTLPPLATLPFPCRLVVAPPPLLLARPDLHNGDSFANCKFTDSRVQRLSLDSPTCKVAHLQVEVVSASSKLQFVIFVSRSIVIVSVCVRLSVCWVGCLFVCLLG